MVMGGGGGGLSSGGPLDNPDLDPGYRLFLQQQQQRQAEEQAAAQAAAQQQQQQPIIYFQPPTSSAQAPATPVETIPPWAGGGTKTPVTAPAVTGATVGDNKLYPDGTVSANGLSVFSYVTNGTDANGTPIVQPVWTSITTGQRTNVGGVIPRSSIPTTLPGATGAGGVPIAGTPPAFIPAPPGYTWAVDPQTGDRHLVDLTPLDASQPLDLWHWAVDDPNNPTVGHWVFTPSTQPIQNPFDGVPKAVIPWLKFSLDQGGSLEGVPPGPIQSWLNYLFNQSTAAGNLRPGEVPFGLGLPNFKPLNIPGPDGTLPFPDQPPYVPPGSQPPAENLPPGAVRIDNPPTVIQVPPGTTPTTPPSTPPPTAPTVLPPPIDTFMPTPIAPGNKNPYTAPPAPVAVPPPAPTPPPAYTPPPPLTKVATIKSDGTFGVSPTSTFYQAMSPIVSSMMPDGASPEDIQSTTVNAVGKLLTGSINPITPQPTNIVGPPPPPAPPEISPISQSNPGTNPLGTTIFGPDGSPVGSTSGVSWSTFPTPPRIGK